MGSEANGLYESNYSVRSPGVTHTAVMRSTTRCAEFDICCKVLLGMCLPSR